MTSSTALRADWLECRLDRNVRETNEMLLPEALARARMREAEQAAQHYREYRAARQRSAARSWQRVADWASSRAARAGADQ